MSMFFAYMAGGEGWGLEVLKCFVRGGQNFFYLLCVCSGGGGGGGRGVMFSTSPSVKKITDPPPPPITKSPKVHYVAYLFLRCFLYYYNFSIRLSLTVICCQIYHWLEVGREVDNQ